MATISTPRTQSPAPHRVQSPTITFSPSSTPSSSVRPSLDVPRIDARSTSPAPPNPSLRKNRVALRDYYNLKSKLPSRPTPSRTSSLASTTSNATASTLTALDDSSISSTFKSQLDEENFDAETYVQELLQSSSLRTVLKAEGSLVSEIKNLDGERKALVYDNYSKLITATQTIGTMRTNMDEAGGGSLRSIAMLGPAIDAVSKSAAQLAGGTDGNSATQKREQRAALKAERLKRDTVRWVLGTPARLQKSLEAGKRDEADADWQEIRQVLVKWQGVRGAAELESACQKVLSQSPEEEEGPDG
jgi:vacuolar protein sorting-associated protein 51